MKLLALILLVGCAGVNHQRATKSEFAPVNYDVIGTVNYLNQGADFIIKGRRENAFRTMYDECNGKYEILEEYETNKPSGAALNYFGGIDYHSESRVFFKYKCVR